MIVLIVDAQNGRKLLTGAAEKDGSVQWREGGLIDPFPVAGTLPAEPGYLEKLQAYCDRSTTLMCLQVNE